MAAQSAILAESAQLARELVLGRRRGRWCGELLDKLLAIAPILGRPESWRSRLHEVVPPTRLASIIKVLTAAAPPPPKSRSIEEIEHAAARAHHAVDQLLDQLPRDQLASLAELFDAWGARPGSPPPGLLHQLTAALPTRADELALPALLAAAYYLHQALPPK